MILSNLSSNVDVESRAVAAMGDTLGRSRRAPGLGAPARDCLSVWGVYVSLGARCCPGA